ncbi:CHAT domain-containing protein [Micromonospora sp. NBC_01796]|uniref:CHAT domain-containing protein n=1 Tax=Micromonospora sp. NBC_01796 TaxID=2975987 RepID=UPI002DD7DFED|nr:CHAT domain-containing protein [Micromonospora sp. NBC_01796]WSA84474.1 CHAT domain-containing protein [Micromonospora sp. NBC_01796]
MDAVYVAEVVDGRTLRRSWSANRLRAQWEPEPEPVAPEARYELRPDGTARIRAADLDLTGRWWQHDGGTVEVSAARAGTTLDALLARGADRSGERLELAALLVRSTLDGPVVTWLTQTLRPLDAVGTEPPPGPVTEPWPFEVLRTASAAHPPRTPFDLLMPVFDLELVGLDQAGSPSPAEAVFTLPDGRGRFTFTLATAGRGDGDQLWWSLGDLDPETFAKATPLRVRRTVAPLPTWYDAEHRYEPTTAELTLRFDPDHLVLSGELGIVTDRNEQRQITFTGPVRGHDVERYRRWLARPTLRGRWLPVDDPTGPITVESVPDGSDPDRTGWSTPSGATVLRLLPTIGLAVGLAPSREGWRAVVLQPPVPDTTGPASLRRLALDLYSTRRPAQAAPLAAAAVARYRAVLTDAPGTPAADHALGDLALLVNHQIVGAFALRDHPALVEALGTAVEIQQRYATAPPGLTLLLRLATDTAELLDTQADLLRALAPTHSTDLVQPTDRAGSIPYDAVAVVAGCAATLRDLVAAAATAALTDPATIASAGNACITVLDTTSRRLRHLAGEAAPDQPATDAPALRRSAGTGHQHRTDTAGVLRTTAEIAENRRSALHRARVARSTEHVRRATPAAVGPLTGYAERWRALLDRDWDKIFAAERAQPFFARLVDLLTDLGAHREALVASEQSRARAFADLLHRTGDDSTGGTSPGTAPALNGSTLRGILRAHRRTVVEYFLHGSRLTVWTVRGDGEPVTAVRVIDPDALATDVNRLLSLAEETDLGPADRPEMLDILARLGALLWEPVTATLLPADPDEPVTVVPHGITLRVPFPALTGPDGRPLAARHAIELLPSLAVLGGLRERLDRRPAREPRLLALVNPQPMPPVPYGSGTLPALTATERVFGAISRHYTAGVDVRYGNQASLAALRAPGSPADVLYLATHADAELVELPPAPDQLAGSEARMPFVALAGTADHDGIVRMRDLRQLHLDADLVVLSCCRGGRGAVAADGIIGMTRAFLLTGPTKLLTSLCSVGEETSMEIMYGFHREWLGGGRPVPAAFRRAHLELIEDHPDDPELWLGFVLFGASA